MNIKLARMLGRLYREGEGEGGSGGGGTGDGITNPGGNIPAFKDLIPAEFKDNPALAPYQDIGALIKSHISAQQMLGTSVQLPKEGDTEAQGKLWEKLGKPKTAEEYEFTLGEDLKDVELNPDLSKWFKETGFKHNLTKAQANGLIQDYIRLEAQQKAGQAPAKTADEIQAEYLGEIEEMFGEETEVKITLAERAGKMFFDEEGQKWLEESGMGNHPQFVKTFAKIGALLKEDENFSSEANAHGFASGPGEAQIEIGRLNADPDFMKAYMNKDALGHADAVKRMSSLYAKAYPGKVAT